ncbi:calpain-A-like isoform X3 [Rhodnius prolixus]|uniref:calpain-A-like isoform X3 n=1 Tax=Rhodnius prolixus TaxID=13249 RepID=UPI003D18EFA1
MILPFSWMKDITLQLFGNVHAGDAEFRIDEGDNMGFKERFDVNQNETSGNSWLMAPMSLLGLYYPLFKFVVPQDQNVGDTGIVHFRIWQYGHWVDVVIDDRLPTHKDELIFARLPERSSFWAVLLEKAFAKLEGRYDALFQGPPPDPLENLTGGVAEYFDDSDDEFNKFEIILQACRMKSLMSCTTSSDKSRLQPNGLVASHTYCISSVKLVDIAKVGIIKLVQLRDPAGNEWKGTWSDYWPNWRNINETDKLKLPLITNVYDGEFWMSFEDYKKNFSAVSLCHLNPVPLLQEKLFQDISRKEWKVTIVEGEWVRGVNAGGQPFYGKFWFNPQYKIEVPDIDQSKKKYSLIIALMEKFIGKRRKSRRRYPEGHTIGFRVYKLDGEYKNQTRPITAEFFAFGREYQVGQGFSTNQRQAVKRVELYPGTYCIVPALGQTDVEGKFLMRLFSEIEAPVKVLDQEIKARSTREVIEATSRTVNLDEEKANEEKLRKLFKEYAGTDEKMDCFELKVVLDCIMRNDKTELENKSSNTAFIWALFRCKTAFEINGGFSKEACRSMIALVDADRSGKLDFEEFKYLYNIIKAWKTVFESYDSLNTGYLNPFDLRPALNSAGYELSNRVIIALGHRYAGRDGRIAIDDFMLCAVRLESMMEIFKDKDPNNTKVATFTVEEWMEKAIYS